MRSPTEMTIFARGWDFKRMPGQAAAFAIGVVAIFVQVTVCCASGNVAGEGHAADHKDDSHAPIRVVNAPTLPAAPFGPSVPLPPTPETLDSSQKPVVEANDDLLILGTGKRQGFVMIPAGPFEMGSGESAGRPDEHPQHNVFLGRFFISRAEVTVGEYCMFLNQQGIKGRDGMPRVDTSSPDCPIIVSNRSFQPKSGQKDRPMVCVSYYGARDYAEWAGARLPTEAEWEKAAKKTTIHPPGDYLTALPRNSSAPVLIAYPGKMGVAGMIGNVWEWCSDWYESDYYSQSPHSNPQGPKLGQERVIRGGSWASVEASKRPANRYKAAPQGYFNTVGFRLVKE